MATSSDSWRRCGSKGLARQAREYREGSGKLGEGDGDRGCEELGGFEGGDSMAV